MPTSRELENFESKRPAPSLFETMAKQDFFLTEEKLKRRPNADSYVEFLANSAKTLGITDADRKAFTSQKETI